MGQVIAWEHCHCHNSKENIMLRLWATPGETTVEGKVKLVPPVAMTQRGRNKEEMPSGSQAMRCKPLLHGPPTSTPTESAVLGDEKKQLEMATEELMPNHPYLWAKTLTSQFTTAAETGTIGEASTQSPLTPAPPPWTHRGSSRLNLLKKASQLLASVPFMHLLETSLNWHRWVSEMLPSNKQAETLSYWTLIKWQLRI